MSKSVKLSRPYSFGSETFDEVRLRAPKFADLLALGDPFEFQKGVIVRYPETIAAYLDRLVSSPAVGAVHELDLKDGVMVREALLGFFLEAFLPDARPTSFSSGSAGDPMPSAT